MQQWEHRAEWEWAWKYASGMHTLFFFDCCSVQCQFPLTFYSGLTRHITTAAATLRMTPPNAIDSRLDNIMLDRRSNRWRLRKQHAGSKKGEHDRVLTHIPFDNGAGQWVSYREIPLREGDHQRSIDTRLQSQADVHRRLHPSNY